MNNILDILTDDVGTVAIAGHVNSDGDCVGSCTALALYIKKNASGLHCVDLYLEPVREELRFLEGTQDAMAEPKKGMTYDLVITCDVSDLGRIAVAGPLFETAGRRVCIDHHISNIGFADINHVEPNASSCAEVLAGLFDMDLVDGPIAECLYTGIIHDSGVFQYRNTTPRTMRVAAALMEKGIDFNRIIDDSFNRRTLVQNRALGHCLRKASAECGGLCITSFITLEEMKELGAELKDLDIIVSQLRLTEGAEAAVFAYETAPGSYKISLRSNDYLDVSEIASGFGGGGHVRAAGCNLDGTHEEVLARVLKELAPALKVTPS